MTTSDSDSQWGEAIEAHGLDEKVESLVRPICDELGLVIYDLDVHPSSDTGLVRVILDRQGADGKPGEGVTIGEITKVTKELSYLLEVEEVLNFDYRLEVSSPGVERTLTKRQHFVMNLGHQARVVLGEMVEGRNVWEGLLKSFEQDVLAVQVSEEQTVEIPFVAIRRAKTLYDFGGAAKPKGGRKSKKG